MKIQDIAFFIILALLIFIHRPKIAVIVGILSLVLAIPLFYFQIFFTAEHLTWYAGGFFLLAIILNLLPNER